MKIYEIGTGYTPIPAQISAATEIIVEELTKAMLTQGRDVQIVDIQAPDRAKTDLPIIEVPAPRFFSRTDVVLGLMHKLKRVAYSVSLAGVLKKILKDTKEKVVFHFHNQYNLFFFLKLTTSAQRRKCVIAYTNHSGIWRLPWSQIEGTIKKRYFQEAVCMKQADLVFLLNEETKENVTRQLGVPERNIVVIGNGVNTDVYRPLPPAEKQAAKARFGLEDSTVVLQVGSVYENKGQLRSLEYLLPMMKKDPSLVFAYAGGIVDGDYQEKIQIFARENAVEQQVRYMGMIAPGDALNALYNAAAATILPSWYEGFSLVSIESCAAGVPVLVDRLGPVRIGPGSVAYGRDDFGSAAAAVLWAGQTEEYDWLCRAARANAVAVYSWAKIVRDYCRAWDSLE